MQIYVEIFVRIPIEKTYNLVVQDVFKHIFAQVPGLRLTYLK